MHSLARILALTSVALLLAAGGAWACCDNGLIDCCDMATPSVSEHCPDTLVLTMDCSLDHAVDVATNAVGAKTVEASLMASALAPFASTMPAYGMRTAAELSTAAGTAEANLYTLHATLRL